MKSNKKFLMQEAEYQHPYHYLVTFEEYNNIKVLTWGMEYYCYISETEKLIATLNYSNLLDVGCGDGKLINVLAKKHQDKEFVGIDLSTPAILLAKGLNYGLENAHFICDDLKNQKKKYDVVVLNEVLEHIPDSEMEVFISNVVSKIKKNGYLVVTVPSKNMPMPAKHYRHYDLEMLKEALKDVEYVSSSFVFKYRSRIVKALFQILARFNGLKKLELMLAQKFLFDATPDTGRHILYLAQKS